MFLLIHLFNVDHIMFTYEKGAASSDFLWDQLSHPVKTYDLRLVCPDCSWLAFSLSHRLTLLLFPGTCICVFVFLPVFLSVYVCKYLLLLLLFSCSVVSGSLWHHGLQHARVPCPSLSPGACSNSYPLSRWCHPSHPVICFSSWFQSFPASGSFPMSHLFTSGG